MSHKFALARLDKLIGNCILLLGFIVKAEIGLDENTVVHQTVQLINQVALAEVIDAVSVPLLRIIRVADGVVCWYTPVQPGIVNVSKDKSTAAKALDNDNKKVDNNNNFFNILFCDILNKLRIRLHLLL